MSSNLPLSLQAALDELTRGMDAAALGRDARMISENYRERTGTGKRLLTREGEAAAYAAARMPATYAAIHVALSEALARTSLVPKTLLDCGAGTGAASWAADDLLALEQVCCLERESAMRAVGAALMRSGSAALSRAVWADWDVTRQETMPQADLVVEGYMLGELVEEMRIPAALRLFGAAREMLLIVEPGTPQGFENLHAIRTALMQAGGSIVAPCPAGTQACPIQAGDWCHFTQRVQRTKLHKTLKGGDAPYEDEKFCYLAVTKAPGTPCGARVLRHPQIAPGRITLTVCEGGEVRQKIVTKKDPLWKQARKMDAGEGL